jgi:hypothetical protein
MVDNDVYNVSNRRAKAPLRRTRRVAFYYFVRPDKEIIGESISLR